MSPAPLLSSDPVSALLPGIALRIDSRLEAELLLTHVLGVDRSWIYAHGEQPLNAEQLAALDLLVQRRERGEPTAYLLGQREFYGRNFRVNPAVLIPRPETELLVDSVLQHVSADAAEIVDVGTGSGCIALTLAAERPGWRLTAVDLSADALAVCRENAERLQLGTVEFLHGDLLTPLSARRFDAIVSNPPYVARNDPHLQRGDLRFEPDLALSAGNHGLDIIARLLDQAPASLRAGGWLFIEHGYDQAGPVQHLFAKAGFFDIITRQDLAGIERVTMGRLSAKS